MNWKKSLLALTCLLSGFGLSILLLRHSSQETRQMVQQSIKTLDTTEQNIKKLDAVPPPHFVPAPHPIDDTQLEVHTLEPIPPGNPFPAHPEPEAYEIKGGDYPAPQDTKK